MLKKGLALLLVPGVMPDRWKISFNGNRLRYQEEFDGASEEIKETTVQLAHLLGFPIIKATEKGLKASIKADQITAVSVALNEFLTQATVLGLLDLADNAYIQSRILANVSRMEVGKDKEQEERRELN